MKPDSNTRFWLLLAAALVLVIIVGGGSGTEGPPLDPRSVAPSGAKGVVETMERLGAEVELDVTVPGRDTTAALMLQDRLTPADRDGLLRWVENGGVLVVADRTSSASAQVLGQTFGPTLDREVCSIDALDDVQELKISGSLFDVSDALGSCFGSDNGRAFIVEERWADGRIFSVGSPNLFTNEVLDDADAAGLALSLLAPEREQARVAFIGPSLVDLGEGGINDLVAPRVVNAIVQLLAAFLLYAIFRSRRLGKVVPEPVPVRLEGSEIVLKAGLLSQRSKDPASVAALVRRDFVGRARQQFSMLDDNDELLIEQLAGQSGMPRDEVRNALTAPVTSEDTLVAITDQISRLDALTFGKDDPAFHDASTTPSNES